MAKLFNLARMTTSTTGTGTITLGSAVSGFLSFASAGVSDGDTVTYAIKDGSNSEIGRGVYTSSGTTLTRSVLRSTNSNSAINLSGAAEVFITAAAEDFILGPITPQGRLTLTSATPVLTSTVSGATTIYYTPYVGSLMPIYDGVQFWNMPFAELTNATAQSSTGNAGPAAVTTNSNYDLFVWNDAGTIRLTRGPLWSSGTARGTGAGTTELERLSGIIVNKIAITNGPAAQRGTYVGTVRSNGSSQIDFTFGSSAAGGGAASFGVWNLYNRRRYVTHVADSTDSWTYSTATWRPLNNSTSNRVSFVQGFEPDFATAFSIIDVSFSASTAGEISVALDSTTVPGGLYVENSGNATAQATNNGARQSADIGWHFFQVLEFARAGTVTIYGDGFGPGGLIFEWWG